ncbi:MAG: hypothetical protein ACREBU_19635, partial [Nitrososphaera sp.]
RKALRLTISLEKQTYLVDEPIYLEMLTSNISNHEIGILPPRLGASWGHFELVLEDESHKPLEYRGVHATMYAPLDWSGSIMAPGERWLLLHDLLGMYGTWGDAAHQIRRYLPPGTYKIQAIYHTNPKAFTSKDPRQENEQTIYSDVLKFHVIEPTGIEREAYETLLTAFATHEAERQKSTHRNILLFKKLINDYPNSVYQPIAYSFLHMIYCQLSDSFEDRRNLVSEAFARFPNSGLTYELLKYERYEDINNLAKAPTVTKAMLVKNLKLASVESRASFYAQCLVDMQRIELRTAERMKESKENR